MTTAPTPRDDGGPAFPVVELHHETGNVCDQHFGASLRDYFAAKAMAALGNSGACWPPSPEQKKAGMKWVDLFASECYEIADAMLEARSK